MSAPCRHTLLASHLLCALVVLATAWPMIRQPRLEDDDYRYLDHIQQWSAGRIGAIEAMTVENRWDHLWFMQEEGRIRFFRPFVVLSYAVDRAIWGETYPLGLTFTNVGIHLACSLVVGFLLFRLLGPGLPATLGAVLFAGLASHSECIWYVAGRTDSLAALAFLGAFALHLSGRRWWALPCFAAGFLTKESVLVLPALLLAYDCWIARRRIDVGLFAAYAVLALAIVAAKQAALGGRGSDFVFPYLVSPLDARFPLHLWLQLRSYAGNLFWAETTVPFADSATVAQIHRPLVLVLGAMAAALSGWMLRSKRLYWLLVAWAVLSWLPASCVYLSERYLYIPSFAFCAVAALVARERRLWGGRSLCLLLALYAGFQAFHLHARHAAIAGQPGSVDEMLGQMAPACRDLEPGSRLLLVNLPGEFIRAQFCENILRVAYHDPAMEVEVLTMMPGQNGIPWEPGEPLPDMGAAVKIGLEGDHGLLLEGGAGRTHMVQIPGIKAFRWTPLDHGTYRTVAGVGAHILDGTTNGATAISFALPRPVEAYRILVWRADCKDLGRHPWLRRRDAVVRRVDLGLE